MFYVVEIVRGGTHIIDGPFESWHEAQARIEAIDPKAKRPNLLVRDAWVMTEDLED